MLSNIVLGVALGAILGIPFGADAGTEQFQMLFYKLF